MCLPLIALGLTVAAAGAAAYGAKQNADAQAASAEYNAKSDVVQAQATQDSARINEQNTYREGDQLAGQARAAMGANGVDPNSGTALLTQTDIGKRTGQDVANQDFTARQAQWGALSQNSLLTAQAANAETAGNISATGSLLSGASQVAGKWSAFNSAGTNVLPSFGS